MLRNSCHDLFRRNIAVGEFFGPGTAGVKHIPWGTVLGRAASSGVVISEAVHDDIPYRKIPPDQHSLRHANPYFVDRQIAAREIVYIQVGRLLQ